MVQMQKPDCPYAPDTIACGGPQLWSGAYHNATISRILSGGDSIVNKWVRADVRGTYTDPLAEATNPPGPLHVDRVAS